MKRFKPYTLGLSFSILFHIPFVYFYLHGSRHLSPPDIILDPIVVQCSITTEPLAAHGHSLPLPPMSLPPRGF